MNVKEFFKLRESDPDHRYEYIDGEVYMMAGGTVRHSRVGANLVSILDRLLDDSPCVVYNSDACFQVSEERYVCPDVTVSCDPRDSDETSEEEELKTVQHPRFVAEVHSPSTSRFDLADKLAFYQEHLSMQEFSFISARVPKVHLYRRESGDRLSINDEVELNSLGVSLSVASLY